MISSSLSFLALSTIGSSSSTSSSSSTNPLVDLEKVKANLLQFKEKIHEKHRMPHTFSAKIEKFTKMKFKPLKEKLEDLTFDETTETNLRGLKIKDNFLTFASYFDSDCSKAEFAFGELVNYCSNIKYENSDEVGSYVVKVNKKENLVVQLLYDVENCKGVPSKATNLILPYTSFTSFDTCFQQMFTYDDDNVDDDGISYIKIGYISTYPTFESGLDVTQTYPESYCSDAHTHYSSYVAYPLSFVYDNVDVCITSGDYSYIYSSSSCAVDGQFYYQQYYNPTCEGTPSYIFPLFEFGCTAPEFFSNADDDDYYYQTNIMEAEFCT